MKLKIEIKGIAEEAHYPLNWLRDAIGDLYDMLEEHQVAEAQEMVEYPVIVKVDDELVRLECKIEETSP